MKNKRELFSVLAVLLLAFFLRLWYLILLKKIYFFHDHPSADVLYYQKWAQAIASGDWLGHGVFNGMPLYPYFLAVVKRLCLGNLFAVRLVHIILGSLNCLLLYHLTKTILPTHVASLAMLLMATNFSLIFYDWLMMPVTLVITLSLCILLVLYNPEQLSLKRRWFLLGIILALALLGDGKFFVFCVLLVIVISLRNKGHLMVATSKILLPLTLGVILILSMVALRNRLVGGHWVLISSHCGLNFYIGNNPLATGTFQNPDFLRPDHAGHIEDQKIIAQNALKRRLSDKEASQFWQQRSLKFIGESPQDYLSLLGKKFLAFITDNEWAYEIDLILQRSWKNKFDFNPYRVVLSFAPLGIVLTTIYPKDTVYLNLLVFSQLVFTLVFFLIDRHRVTILPCLIIYQAYTLSWLWEQIQHRQWVRFSTGLSCVLIAFLLFKGITIDQKTIQFLKLSKSAPILDAQGEYKKAQEQYLAALKHRPFDVNTLYNLATSYALDGQFTTAIQYFKKALTINPYDINVHYNLASTYEQSNQAGQALREYQQVIDLIPESFDAHFRMAEIYKSLGNCPEAIEHYSSVSQIKPNFASEIQRYIQDCQ